MNRIQTAAFVSMAWEYEHEQATYVAIPVVTAVCQSSLDDTMTHAWFAWSPDDRAWVPIREGEVPNAVMDMLARDTGARIH